MAGNSCLNPGIENKHVSNPPLSDFSPTWGKIRVLPGRDGQADTFERHRLLWMVAGRVMHTISTYNSLGRNLAFWARTKLVYGFKLPVHAGCRIPFGGGFKEFQHLGMLQFRWRF